MKQFTDHLLLELRQNGYQACVTDIKHLQDLQEDIEGQYEQDVFDEEFYKERLAWFDFQIPDSLSGAASLIVVAVPSLQSQAIFTSNEKSRTLTLPPTYVAYDETRKKVEDVLMRILTQKGYRIAHVKLPLKLLAVRSGLGSYGKNNICYVTDMGSFLQLVAVFSDMPCQEDSWYDVQMMKRCQNCNACRKKCPTGAISSDRFLLHAEKCIVFHNEKSGTIPFPVWIDPSWHNCLVGCLHCQKVCPENTDYLQWVERIEKFSEEETTLLLKGVTLEQLQPFTTRKLKNLDLIESLDILPRNLGVFFKQ